MGDHQDDTGWRPPVIFALVAVAAVIACLLWPNWLNYCPEKEQLAECSRQWISALSGWFAFGAAAITLLYLARQNQIAATSLKVAHDSLEETRRSNERQQRAYVMVDSCKLVGCASGSPEVLVTIENVGTTPAFRVSVRHRPFMVIGSPPAVDVLLNQVPIVENAIDLGQSHQTTAAYRVAPADFAQFQSAQSLANGQLYVVGDATYRDAFDIQRRLQFCMLLEPGRQLVDGDLSFAHFGNFSS